MQHVNPLESSVPRRSPHRGLRRRVAALSVSFAVGAVLALAGSTRGQSPCTDSFERSGVAPWHALGTTGTSSNALYSAPPDGALHAVIIGGSSDPEPVFADVTGFGVTLALLANSLAVPANDIESLSPGTATRGAAIERTFTVAPGDVLSFSWEFITLEAVGESQYRDFAVLSMSSESPQAILLADTLTPGMTSLVLPSGQGAQHTGYRSFTHVFTSAGLCTIGFAVLQVGDTYLDSALTIDLLVAPGSAPDSDGDGLCDLLDDCPNDPAKFAPGGCGCGVADVATTYYPDVDSDGYGDDALPQAGLTCTVPPGLITTGGDCDDSNAAIHPGAGDPCNGVDDDCDGIVDPGFIGAYCTAGVTTHGCTPQVLGIGMPSSIASSGFEIVVEGVEGGQNGLIYYGLQAAALPWGPGSTSFRCVAVPFQRMSVHSAGGSFDACDGTLHEDFNAWVQTHVGALGTPFSPGDVVFAQGWFRDPAAARSTNLSDALRFTLCE